jgi:cytochrome c oxidase subunit 2
MLDGLQSVLSAHGPHAAVAREIAWVLFAAGAAIFAAVMALALYAVFARRERARRLSSRWMIVGGGALFPVLTLSALLVYTLVRAGAIPAAGEGAALRIEVTGEQWWWRVRYFDAGGAPDFVTANEIRIPAGRAIDLELKSADVIHGFWVPALAGKLDMIPGRTNRLRIVADRPGDFRGQCAEYCGGPHAFMAFRVVAEEPSRYEAWAARQREPAAQPEAEPAARGAAIFRKLCAACHTVRGTAAAGVRGPDLTHVAGRVTIGAGMLPNNAGTLAAWIASSQHIKPGNLMPSFRELSGEELRSLAGYLEALD